MKVNTGWIVRHPIAVVVFLVVVTCLAGSQIAKLEIDSSAEGLMVERDPERDYYESVKEWFGSDNLTVVRVKADDIFTTETLQTIARLTDALSDLEGVTRVDSLSTVNKIKSDDGMVDTGQLMPEVPTDPEDIEQLRSDTLSNDIFIRNLVSSDCKYTAINVYTESPKGDKGFNKRFSDGVDRIIQEHGGDLDIYQLGGPLTKITFSSFIEKDQRTLVPLSILVLVLIFVFSFRCGLAIVVPIVTGALSIFWTFAFMSMIGYPINVLTVLVPALLIAIGATEDAHMLSEYVSEIGKGKGKDDALLAMVSACGLPTFLTALTTFLGFLTIAVNKITILKQFGIVASFGMVANYVITITVVPTVLRFARVPKRFRELEPQDDGAVDTLFRRLVLWLGDFVMGHKRIIAGAAIGLVVVSLVGALRLRVNNDLISFFKEDCFIRRRWRDLHEHLAGASNFYVVVETGEPDRVKHPFVLQRIASLQDYIDQLGKFDKTISLADHIEIMNREMHEGDKQYQCVPDAKTCEDPKGLIAQYLLIMDPDDIEKYVDYDFSRACIVVRHNVASSWELKRLLKQIRTFCDKNFPHLMSVRFSGENILVNRAADAMVVGQAASFLLALACIFVIMSFLFVSLKAGLISLIPNALPICINFGLMGWLGVPLNTGTCMVAAIALGIAVDDTIHLMARYRGELSRTPDQEHAMRRTVATEARPVLATSTALALGFSVLVFSNFNPTVNFGYLSAVVMISALAGDLFVTPVLCVTTRLITVWDLVVHMVNKELAKMSPLFHGMSRKEIKCVVLSGALQECKPDEEVVRQDTEGEGMYVILKGGAKVRKRDEAGVEAEVAQLQEGDIFGEMAVLDGEKRSASVLTDQDADLLMIDSSALDRLSSRFPKVAVKVLRNLARVLSQRLRERH